MSVYVVLNVFKTNNILSQDRCFFCETNSASVIWPSKISGELNFGCGGWIWTSDLQVMSLTSYQTAPPRDKNCIFVLFFNIIFYVFFKQTRLDIISHSLNFSWSFNIFLSFSFLSFRRFFVITFNLQNFEKTFPLKLSLENS